MTALELLTPGRRATGAALTTVVAGVMPFHLTGALAPELQETMNFGDAELGIGIAIAFGLSAALTASGGAFTDRAGPFRALRLGLVFSVAGALVLAVSPSYWVLLGGLMLAAPGNAIAQPGSNVMIADGVRAQRRGTALGIKQSAIAVSTGLSGLVSLTIAAAFGWRWAFLVVMVVAWGARWLVQDLRSGRPVEEHTTTVQDAQGVLADRATARAATLIGLAGAAAVASIGTFLVRAATDAGLAASTGRIVLLAGSVLLIVMRVGWGVLADRGHIDPSRAVPWLLVSGTAGYLLLSTGTLAGFIAGAALAFGAGWAWPGLLFLALVRRFPEAPGRISGRVQRGMFIGATVGPLLFGTVAETISFAAAWWMSAGWGLVAAAGAVIAVRAERR